MHHVIKCVPLIGILLAGCAKESPTSPALIADYWGNGTQVYFGFDSTALSSQGTNSLKSFVMPLEKTNNTQKIFVCGHSDTVGSAEAKLAISRKRAEVVRRALIDMGIMAERISVRAVGDAELAVATRPETREPQNRRVSVNVEGAAGLGIVAPCRL